MKIGALYKITSAVGIGANNSTGQFCNIPCESIIMLIGSKTNYKLKLATRDITIIFLYKGKLFSRQFWFGRINDWFEKIK